MIKTIKGDLIKLALQGKFDVIVHGCNCFNTFGAGIAKQIKENFPEANDVDQQTIRGDKMKLGTCTTANSKGVTVVNAYTQYRVSFGSDVFDYKAFDAICRQLAIYFDETQKIGMPLIGCGLARGDKATIISIIEKHLSDHDVTIVEFAAS